MIDPAQYADFYQPNFGRLRTSLLDRAALEKLPREKLLIYEQYVKQWEQEAIQNPIKYGWTLAMWNEIQTRWKSYRWHILLGGNRSTKSTFLARIGVWGACTFPGSEVHMYQANSEKSINEQQRYVFESIPAAIKALPTKKGIHHSLTFSQKNGFTDDICIFPPHSGARRGGYIKFRNYAQFSDDPNTAESFKSHLTIFDEECPLDLFQTAQYRSVDYHGRIFLGFTTIMGWTPLVQHLLARTKTLVKRKAPLLGGIELPVIQEAMFEDPKSMTGAQACIYYLWTEDNPFIDVNDFRKQMLGKPREEILARAYGIPTKSVAGIFPAFSKEVNVIPHDQLPFLKNPAYRVTRYMAIDPAGSKNWAMLWVAVDAAGSWFVYREWPDYDDWALPGNKPGPAQKGSRRGIRDYVDLIEAAEGVARDADRRIINAGEDIYERYIDPRMGAAETQSKDEGARTIISDLDECDMLVMPASGVDIENGLQLINGLLAWDDRKERDSLNTPRLFISDRCQNLIYAMSEYTAKLGPNEAVKDFIDPLRYLAVSNIAFFDTKKDVPVRTGVY